ncbi:MAG: sulfotransferase [Acidimicrobiales bacterium]
MRPSADNDPNRPRIFGIGLNKTGTTSLHEVLTILGFESLHWGGPEAHDRVVRAVEEEVPLLTYLDPRYDAFSDIGVLSRRFSLCDRQYPGSRYILTVRPVEEWLDSRRRHVERNRELAREGRYSGSFLEVDMDKWRKEWDTHMERAHRYFAGRDDMIEIDVTAGPGWEPFCELLGVPVPAVPFPWKNKG